MTAIIVASILVAGLLVIAIAVAFYAARHDRSRFFEQHSADFNCIDHVPSQCDSISGDGYQCVRFVDPDHDWHYNGQRKGSWLDAPEGSP